MLRRLIPTVGLAAAVVAAGIGAAAAQTSVTVMRPLDADRYDPHKSTARSTAEVLFMMGDTLVALDYDMKTVVPNLAESWTISEDGKVYTFKLKKGVKFCSGKDFTAADVVASIERWLADETKGVTKNRAGDVEKLVAVDDHTLEYHLKQPYSELLFQMTMHNHTIINIDQVKELGEDFGVQGFDGTGPYCWDKWEPRNELVLKKHEGYNWGPPIYDTAEAQVDQVIWKIVPEENSLVNSLMAGQGDVSQYLPLWSVDQLKAAPTVEVSQAENYFWTRYVGMKITREKMQDVRVRTALNLAVDQSAIVDGILFGYAIPAHAYIAPNVLDYNETIDESPFGYDPEKAKALLDEAGWKVGSDGIREKDGEKMTLTAYSFQNSREVMEAMQADFRKIGVDMDLQIFDATVIWGKLATQEFDLYTMSYPYVSAGDAMNLYFPSGNRPTPNRMNWASDETDDWLLKARGALTDADRKEWIGKVQKQVHEAVVWIPIAHDILVVGTNQKLKPIKAHGIYGCGLYKGLNLELAG